MRIIVCGGRDYQNRTVLFEALDELHTQEGIDLLIHGNARGADQLADRWATERGIPVHSYSPDWSLGRKAGPLRNQRMIDDSKPDGVVAFCGGRGTDDMIRRAWKAGLKVWQRG
jgi:YspA, cpYpsA-related SLOG family